MISVKAMSLLKSCATEVDAGTAGVFGTGTVSNSGAGWSAQA